MSDFVASKDTCPKCKEPFDVELSLISSSVKHRLPFTCNKCFSFTMCGTCFKGTDWSTFECPVCDKKQGFDRDDPVPNRLLCSILEDGNEQHSQEQGRRKSQHVIVSPAASDKVRPSKKGSSSKPARPKQKLRSLKIAASKARGSAAASKMEESPTSGNNKKGRTSMDDCRVGDRVYCLWPRTQRWYWGHIKRVNIRANRTRTYKIVFDDGDVRENAKWDDFVTEEQYKEKGLVNEPKKKNKAKASHGKTRVGRRHSTKVDSTTTASHPKSAILSPPGIEVHISEQADDLLVDSAADGDDSSTADGFAFFDGSYIPSKYV